MGFQNAGTTTLKAFDTASLMGGRGDSVAKGLAASLTARDAASSSTNAFLVSELEKRDPKIREPLKAVTWPDNIPVRVGGGFQEYLSNLNVDYGSAGDSADANVAANGSTVMPLIQANFGKDIFKTHIFVQPLSINEIDMERQAITGRSLDTILGQGVRLHYDKHMDKNVFIGLAGYGTTGLLNNPNVFAANVVAGVSTLTAWNKKTPDEILYDINSAITATWAASGNDSSAIPNHILLPFEQYNYIATTKVSAIAEKTILTFILENNIAKIHGEELVFGVSLYGKTAGTGSTARMAVYCHDERFVAVDELQPLTRRRTMYIPSTMSFDTNYIANVSEVEIFYPQTISYYDGI